MQRKHYTSDISREQFALIRPALEGIKRKTRPRTHDLYDIFCGVVYVLKSGCTWRLLPGDFPPWRTVHEYFRQWSGIPDGAESSLLESALKKCGQRRTYSQWSSRQDDVLHHRRAKCKEHRHGAEQGI